MNRRGTKIAEVQDCNPSSKDGWSKNVESFLRLVKRPDLYAIFTPKLLPVDSRLLATQLDAFLNALHLPSVERPEFGVLAGTSPSGEVFSKQKLAGLARMIRDVGNGNPIRKRDRQIVL